MPQGWLVVQRLEHWDFTPSILAVIASTTIFMLIVRTYRFHANSAPLEFQRPGLWLRRTLRARFLRAPLRRHNHRFRFAFGHKPGGPGQTDQPVDPGQSLVSTS